MTIGHFARNDKVTSLGMTIGHYQGHQLPHQLPLPELLPEPLDELPTVGHFWFDT